MIDFEALASQFDSLTSADRRTSAIRSTQVSQMKASLEGIRYAGGWASLSGSERPNQPGQIYFRQDPSRGYPPDEPPRPVTLTGVVGNHLAPEPSIVPDCYLLHAGYAVMHYGTFEKPEKGVTSAVRHAELDRSGFSGEKVRTDAAWMARSLSLFRQRVLLDTSRKGRISGREVFALMQGSLLRLPGARDTPDNPDVIVNQRSNRCLEVFRDDEIPVVAYESFPQERDVIEKITSGPGGKAVGIDAETSDLVRDQDLFAALLAPGERSACFLGVPSEAGWSPDLQIAFFYIRIAIRNREDRIVRVEFPVWDRPSDVSESVVHSVIVDQVEKGGGYPAVLVEAYRTVAITPEERDRFYARIESCIRKSKGSPFSLDNRR